MLYFVAKMQCNLSSNCEREQLEQDYGILARNCCTLQLVAMKSHLMHKNAIQFEHALNWRYRYANKYNLKGRIGKYKDITKHYQVVYNRIQEPKSLLDMVHYTQKSIIIIDISISFSMYIFYISIHYYSYLYPNYQLQFTISCYSTQKLHSTFLYLNYSSFSIKLNRF